MNEETEQKCIAFAGTRRIASGPVAQVARTVKEQLDGDEHATVLIFDTHTSAQIEIDFRGSIKDVLTRLESTKADELTVPPAPRGRGRPKLGVVSREVTLLPRHWDWLKHQPGGASVTLRKLVEEARRTGQDGDTRRHAQGAAYAFMHAIGGDLPGFEEASRALFAGDGEKFGQQIAEWPIDIREHVQQLASKAFA